METVLVAVAIILFSGIASLILNKFPAATSVFSVIGIVLGCIVGLVPVVAILINGGVDAILWPWSVPSGNFSVAVDPLSAVFLLIIFVISIPVAIYGASYLWHHRSEHNLGVVWFFTAVLIASMALVVVARNAVLFLVAWELMSVSSFFLVAFEDRKRSVRRASLIYLIATHIGAAFLLVFFLLMGRESGSLDFNSFRPSPEIAGLLFILALVGFGSKAGFIPLHVWLPEAHPAAPSHISALMSGVMIKMGIYGIARTIIFLGRPPEWWGWLLLAVGLSSGVLGVLFALAQHDLKRLLAYHSVENIGIIAMGLGIGLLGMSFQAPMISVLGFGGGLLHVVNHALFKGLLFLGAGAVVYRTGTREIDKLGGILKRMPWTGVTFLIGSIAICGLPPLNGFISEFLIYLSALYTDTPFQGGLAVANVMTIVGLSLIGGLAVACFTKAFGMVFLGQPRAGLAADVHEVGLAMKTAMVLLAVGCFAIAFLAPVVISFLVPVIAQVSQMPLITARELLARGTVPLYYVLSASFITLGLVALTALWRLNLLSVQKVNAAVTWDCGYARPSSRMQYTASSFALPITKMFQALLRTVQHFEQPEGIFPKAASLKAHTPDVFQELLFRPVFIGIRRALGAFRWLQHGNVHLYILYILITLLVLMFWKLQ